MDVWWFPAIPFFKDLEENPMALGFPFVPFAPFSFDDLWGTNYVLAGFVALGATNPSAEWTTLDQARIFPSPASLLHSFGGLDTKKHPNMSRLTISGIWTKTIYGKHTPTISTRTNELTNRCFREHLRGATCNHVALYTYTHFNILYNIQLEK